MTEMVLVRNLNFGIVGAEYRLLNLAFTLCQHADSHKKLRTAMDTY